MTEWEKAQNGYLYDANYDQEIVEARTRCADLCYEFNNCKPSESKKQGELLSQMFGSIKGNPVVTAPFYCDYGFNISVGENFYTNHNVTILDGAKVTFGDNVFIAPNCVFSTAGHAERARTGNRSVDYYRGQCLDWNERVGAAGRDDWKQYHYRRRERCEQEYSGWGNCSRKSLQGDSQNYRRR